MYKSNLNGCIALLRTAATAATAAAADTVKVRMQVGLSGPRRSAPGQMPGCDSGSLVRSITTVPFRQTPDDAEYLVAIDPNAAGPGKTPPWLYGIFLEGGTSRMAPRPFFGPIARSSSVHQAMMRSAATAAKKVLE